MTPSAIRSKALIRPCDWHNARIKFILTVLSSHVYYCTHKDYAKNLFYGNYYFTMKIYLQN